MGRKRPGDAGRLVGKRPWGGKRCRRAEHPERQARHEVARAEGGTDTARGLAPVLVIAVGCVVTRRMRRCRRVRIARGRAEPGLELRGDHGQEQHRGKEPAGTALSGQRRSSNARRTKTGTMSFRQPMVKSVLSSGLAGLAAAAAALSMMSSESGCPTSRTAASGDGLG